MSGPFFTPEQIANIRPLSDAPKEWQQLYLGSFRQQLEPAHLLWVWYYGKTESYDQSVCRHRDKRGVAIPVAPEERRLCGEHARSCMKIERWVARGDFDPADFASVAKLLRTRQ